MSPLLFLNTFFLPAPIFFSPWYSASSCLNTTVSDNPVDFLCRCSLLLPDAHPLLHVGRHTHPTLGRPRTAGSWTLWWEMLDHFSQSTNPLVRPWSCCYSTPGWILSTQDLLHSYLALGEPRKHSISYTRMACLLSLIRTGPPAHSMKDLWARELSHQPHWLSLSNPPLVRVT